MTQKVAGFALFALLTGSCTPTSTIPPSRLHGVTGSLDPLSEEKSRLADISRWIDRGRHERARRDLDRLLGDLVMSGRAGKAGGSEVLGSALDAWDFLNVLDRIPIDEPFPDPTPGWWTAEDLRRPEVQEWKERFLANNGRGLRKWLRQAGPYFPDMMRTIEASGLPRELWVLTIVESGFRMRAVSRAKAVGPWQFMANTARYCGLLITTDRDERRDWIAATKGACRYLTELHEDLGDGLLALAAFNCGPSRVRRELAKSETRDFWGLMVPPETRQYIPRVLALVDILGNGEQVPYAVDTTTALTYAEFEVPYTVEVAHLAKACGVSSEDLYTMNPAWLLPITPADGKPVRARIPRRTLAPVRKQFANKDIPIIKVSPGRIYEIRKGDTLWDISRTFRVNLNTLLKVNGLTGKEVIRPGREIRVPG